MPIDQKEITFNTEVGFPVKIYISMIDWLGKRGYTVKKVKDWLEVNPKTAYHQDMIQRRQVLEQSLGRVLAVISDLRRDIEMIKHDLRKFEQVERHIKEKRDDILKSDYIDLIDQNSQSSLLKLQAAGRFPSIVIDFMRVKNKDDIAKLKASKTEKNILEIKLQLYEEWKQEYGKAVQDRVKILREELNSKNAALENDKKSIQPYLQALNKIKLSEGHYTGLTDPLLVEGYSTSVSGIEIEAWRGFEPQEKYTVPKGGANERFSHYVYFKIKIRKDTVAIQGKEIEAMKVVYTVDYVDEDFIMNRSKEIEKLEDMLERELEKFSGKREQDIEKIETKQKSMMNKGKKSFFNMLGFKNYKSKGYMDEVFGNIAKEESVEFNDMLKSIIGGLSLEGETKEWA